MWVHYSFDLNLATMHLKEYVLFFIRWLINVIILTKLSYGSYSYSNALIVYFYCGSPI